MRTLTVVLAALTLGACHKHENPAGSGSAGSAQPTTNVAPAPVPTPTIDAAVAGGPDPWAAGSGSADASSSGSGSGAGSGSDAAPHRKLGKDVMEKEKIHDVALGDSMAAAEKQLGKPDSRSKPEEVEATGDTTQTWKYGASEVTFKKGDKGDWTVLSFHVMPPADWTTSQGIHIGSTKAEVQAGYKGKADAESVLVGSEYGGELFTLKDGKVSEIFLGAMAE